MKLFKRRKETYLSSDREPDEDQHEEIEYEPVSVRELLVEMKDISELMVDLAYGAVAFDAREIAEEVEDLELRIGTLNYHIRLQAMMAARSRDDAERLAGILQVAAATDRIAQAAADIANLVTSRVPLRDFLPRLLANAEESLVRLSVPNDSPAAGATIGASNIQTETGNRIIAVRRGKTWIYGPGRKFELKEKDMLICRGRVEGAKHLGKWLRGEVDAL